MAGFQDSITFPSSLLTFFALPFPGGKPFPPLVIGPHPLTTRLHNCKRLRSHSLPEGRHSSFAAPQQEFSTNCLFRATLLLPLGPLYTGGMATTLASFGMIAQRSSFGGHKSLEYLHPWAERQALEMRFEGLQACTKFFQGGTPPLLLAYWLFNEEYSQILARIFSHSQKWHDSLNRKWMRPQNVGAARATLTREDSEYHSLWSHSKSGVPWSFKSHGLMPFGVNMPFVYAQIPIAHFVMLTFKSCLERFSCNPQPTLSILVMWNFMQDFYPLKMLRVVVQNCPHVNVKVGGVTTINQYNSRIIKSLTKWLLRKHAFTIWPMTMKLHF